MAAVTEIRLVLWDIDHTLIETRGVGRTVYERVFPAVTGQPLRELATVHGRTELDIIHDTLELHGVTATDDTVNRLAAALADGYRAAADELAARGRVLPGAREALETLAKQAGVRQSVLTGNTRDVAHVKIEVFGLGQYLDLRVGAYGDDHRDRATLVAVARARASERFGHPVDADKVLVIGDTPNDVSAAQAAGAHVIGIATGRYSADDLRGAGARTTLASLTDLTQLTESLAVI